MKLSLFDRGMRWAKSAPPSIQGAGGSRARFNLIDFLAVGLGLPDHEVFQILTQSGWNDACSPPWPIKELEAAIPRVRQDSRKAPRYLLKPSEGTDVRRSISTGKKPHAHPARPIPDPEADEKALLRNRWTKPAPLKWEQREQICFLRGTVREAVELACDAGLLHYETVFDHADRHHHPSYVLAHGNIRQARRLDGVQWTTKAGTRTKSKNLPGSLASSFFGDIGGAGDNRPVLIVEGVVGYLEALTVIRWYRLGAPDWVPLAAHSAPASRFANDPDLCKAITGRHCRIVRDNDPAGSKAADGWVEELLHLGCNVELVTLPAEAKDLGCLIKADPAESFPILNYILAPLPAEEVPA